MHIIDTIRIKRDGGELSREQIQHWVSACSDGSIPDYQASALLMAIYFRGLNERETAWLTHSMIHSGKTLSLPPEGGIYVDKHSTGGVGDKISLILAPAVAACGVSVPMMSGRALGHTGGTLDKLDSIPGYRTRLDEKTFLAIMKECGFAMTGQTDDMVPADRYLYSLRDVTATVESIPLITASILSKKFAEGADALVFDVKSGSGAFMKNEQDAQALANSLVQAAGELGRKAYAIITAMDNPLGYAVGNFLEIEETIACLRGKGPEDVMEVSRALSARMIFAAEKVESIAEAAALFDEVIENGKALDCFYRNVRLQGGDVSALQNMLGNRRAAFSQEVFSAEKGWVSSIDAGEIGRAGVALGVGRNTKEDDVSPDAGFLFAVRVGQQVEKGQLVCTVYGDTKQQVERAAFCVYEAVKLASSPPQKQSSRIRKEIAPE